MNIQEAKKQIKEAVAVYLSKDAYGEYKIPPERQRPVFLIGAPGIGKTAIVEQIASELDIALVSYSMTHHTRQSALGLPVIVHKKYGESEFDVSEYTMSEIIASVYDKIEQTGKKEGILFLDEVNSVSETLGPSMLQFLQYKKFGNHSVPRGWIIVTAGNPSEYNRSAREFDYVILDRLKVMEIEPDYDAWASYARERGIHRAVRAYLDIRTEDFYSIGMTADGKNYVTARGWEDLSEAITLYEEQGFDVGEELIVQYLRNPLISSNFARFYTLYNKYKEDYHISDILSGEAGEEISERAKAAKLDERITVLELILDALMPKISGVMTECDGIKLVLPGLREIKENISGDSRYDIISGLDGIGEALRSKRSISEATNGIDNRERSRYNEAHAFISASKDKVENSLLTDVPGQFGEVSEFYSDKVTVMKRKASDVSKQLENAFVFVEKNFGTDNEMLIFMTELTANPDSAEFISEFGCDEYFKYNSKFLLYEREQKLRDKIAGLQRREDGDDD